MSEAVEVIHDEASTRYTVTIDGHVAELVYRRDGERIVFEHTRVPDELGGRGIAGQLVQVAIDQAAAGGLVVVPECPYVKGWLEKNPDDAARITIEWPA